MSRVLLSVCLTALFAGSAQAGIIDWHAQWMDNSPFDMEHTGWSWDGGNESWAVWENYVAPVIDQSASQCWGEADTDPTIHITKTITNGSTFDWTDYHLVVTGSAGVSYDVGSAVSDVFGTVVETAIVGGYTIDFYAPNSVPIGTDVTIDLDITIPAGNFTFDISQTPTPEPGSMALLLMGGLALLRRRS